MPPRIVAPPCVDLHGAPSSADTMGLRDSGEACVAFSEKSLFSQGQSEKTPRCEIEALVERSDTMIAMLRLVLERLEIEAIRHRGSSTSTTRRAKWSWNGTTVDHHRFSRSSSEAPRRVLMEPCASEGSEGVLHGTGQQLGAISENLVAEEVPGDNVGSSTPPAYLRRAMTAVARVPRGSANPAPCRDDEGASTASTCPPTPARRRSLASGIAASVELKVARREGPPAQHLVAAGSFASSDGGSLVDHSSTAAHFSQWLSPSTGAPPTQLDVRSRRKRIWQFMEDKDSSVGANLYYWFVTATIGVGVMLSILDLAFPEKHNYRYALSGFEILLGCELVMRFIVCPNRHTFWLDIYCVVDLLVCLASAAPLIALALFDMDPEVGYSCRVFLPLLLCLRYLRRFDKFHLLAFAFKEAAQALPVLLYTLLLIALFHGALIYLLEPRSSLPGLQDALWFTMTTMSTVGYADPPVTNQGKAATLTLSTISSLYLAIPLGIVGNTFSHIWQDRDRLVLMQQMRRRIARSGYTPADLIRMFRRLDQDNSRTLTFVEFKEFLPIIQVTMPEALALKIFETIDEDGEGTISFEEFLAAIFPAHHFYMKTMNRRPRPAGRKRLSSGASIN